jgi:hypothetical protein
LGKAMASRRISSRSLEIFAFVASVLGLIGVFGAVWAEKISNSQMALLLVGCSLFALRDGRPIS